MAFVDLNWAGQAVRFAERAGLSRLEAPLNRRRSLAAIRRTLGAIRPCVFVPI